MKNKIKMKHVKFLSMMFLWKNFLKIFLVWKHKKIEVLKMNENEASKVAHLEN
jgi:hypothetical protein